MTKKIEENEEEIPSWLLEKNKENEEEIDFEKITSKEDFLKFLDDLDKEIEDIEDFDPFEEDEDEEINLNI